MKKTILKGTVVLFAVMAVVLFAACEITFTDSTSYTLTHGTYTSATTNDAYGIFAQSILAYSDGTYESDGRWTQSGNTLKLTYLITYNKNNGLEIDTKGNQVITLTSNTSFTVNGSTYNLYRAQ